MMHPPTETLVAHASGHLDRALRVVLEAHLDLCPACRAELAALSEPGGRLLGEMPRVAPSETLWARLAQRIEATEREKGADPIPPSVPLPAAARAELGDRASKLRWRRPFLRGARLAVLAEDPESGVSLALAHMPGGRVFPRHEHRGFEHAVVLAGGYEDERGSFVAGDFAIYEPGSEHGPHTLDGDDCWILFRLDGNVRFRGWRGWLQRLFG